MATNKTRIKIRHGSTTPATGTDGLLPYELGWDGSHSVLYINNNGAIRQITSENAYGIPLISGDNVDTLLPGIYYSASGSVSKTLSGTKPNGDNSGFRLEVIRGYGTNYGAQIAYDSTGSIKIRKNPVYHDPVLTYSDFTGIPWRSIITSTDIASKTSIGIVTTGAQSFVGRKTFGYVNRDAYNDSGTAVRWACDTQVHNAAGTLVAEYWYDIGDATNVTFGRWGIRAYSPNSTANTTTTGKYETFYLPNVNTGRTDNADYNIITTKNPADLGYYLPLSGGTMTNTAKFVSGSGIYAEGSPMLYFLSGSASSYQKQGAIFTDSTTVNSKRVCSRFYFREYSYNSTTGAAIEYWDQYRLPVVTADKTSSDSYEILTSKSAVTIAQGGTSATTAGAAANNLLLGLPTWTANPNDDTYFIRRDTAGGDAFGQVKASTIYNYVKGKTDTLYVKKAGDTMSGDLAISKTSNPQFKAIDTTVNADFGVYMSISSNHKTHGLFSTGYTTGGTAATFTASRKWMLYRSTDGEAHTELKLYGAVWNDYAEYRNTLEDSKPGQCVIENGDDSLRLSTSRMQRAAHIVSDTFGFAIGKTDKCKTPVAVSGRVLAYLYEGREAARGAIGRPVCSGPNGTVSIMTDEEYKNFGYCAIGTISAVPDYEKWGEKDEEVDVNGRIWIKVY